jgi:hypothetical protein
MSWWAETQGSRQTLGTCCCCPSSIVYTWYFCSILSFMRLLIVIAFQPQCMLHNHSQIPRGPCPSPRFFINQKCLETNFRFWRMSTVSPPCIPPYLISQRLLGNPRRWLILQSSNHSRPFPWPNAPFASSLTPTQNASTALALDPSTDAYPSNSGSHSTVKPAAPILPAATKTEKFFLTAADQESGSRDERLNSVIQSKYEAGLLKPYNYVKGYARLSRWMDCKFVLLFSRPDPLYSPLRFCKRVSRIETTDLTTIICAKTKIQGKRTL